MFEKGFNRILRVEGLRISKFLSGTNVECAVREHKKIFKAKEQKA
jgi:hypothetical protein